MDGPTSLLFCRDGFVLSMWCAHAALVTATVQ